MTNLDNILKSRDISLPTKFCLVKAMVFPVVMYGYESWIVKKAECRKIDVLNCGVGEYSWESLGLQGDLLPKGDKSWVVIGRTDAKAETPIFWPPHVKNWLIENGQGGLECCDSWGHKESFMTEQLNWTELKCDRVHVKSKSQAQLCSRLLENHNFCVLPTHLFISKTKFALAISYNSVIALSCRLGNLRIESKCYFHNGVWKSLDKCTCWWKWERNWIHQ